MNEFKVSVDVKTIAPSDTPPTDFERAMGYVLDKNQELYQRLS